MIGKKKWKRNAGMDSQKIHKHTNLNHRLQLYLKVLNQMCQRNKNKYLNTMDDLSKFSVDVCTSSIVAHLRKIHKNGLKILVHKGYKK